MTYATNHPIRRPCLAHPASRAGALLALVWLALVGAGWRQPLAIGDPIERVVCPPGYRATLYAAGLESPDGLAFNPDGALYVAEEAAGRVSRIEPDGSATPILEHLASPEGITFDTTGNLYVVEDVRNGRVLRMATDAQTTTLAIERDAPEGVVWLPDGTPDGVLYITESNVEFAQFPDFRTRVTAVFTPGITAEVRSDEPFWSYSAIAAGSDGRLYVANEASGIATNEAIFRIDPMTRARTLFARDMVGPEGLRFGAGGAFPLYVAEERDENGRLSQVAANGAVTPLCDGLATLEDVALDAQGNLYVSEDATGQIVRITPPNRFYLPLVRR